MMKKFILALISMSLLLASGCAHIEEYDTEETADTEETTEVQTVTVDNPEYYTRFKNDGISINVYNWGEYIPALRYQGKNFQHIQVSLYRVQYGPCNEFEDH